MSFQIEMIPRFSEIDRYGVLHHSVYFLWFEAARIAFVEAMGVDLEQLHREGYCFLVVSSEVRFRKPARPGMKYRVTCELTSPPLAKIQLVQKVLASGSADCLVEATFTLAAIKDEKLALRLPGSVQAVWQRQLSLNERKPTYGNFNGIHSPSKPHSTKGAYGGGQDHDDPSAQPVLISV